MDVKTVCLGMLSDGEASGYDLKKHFESTFGHFFAAGYGSIYPALSALLADDFVECREESQSGRPDRKVYRITDAGREALCHTLNTSNPGHKVRSEFLATMCFAHLMNDEQLNQLLQHRIEEAEEYLRMFDEIESTCMQDWPAGKKFVCGFGRALTEATKKYIEEHRDLVCDRQATPRSANG